MQLHLTVTFAKSIQTCFLATGDKVGQVIFHCRCIIKIKNKKKEVENECTLALSETEFFSSFFCFLAVIVSCSEEKYLQLTANY